MLQDLITRYPELEVCQASIQQAVDILIHSYQQNGKVLVCGNGGSCCDADHITGELMKGFCSRRILPKQMQDRLCRVDAEMGAALCTRLQCALPCINLAAHAGLFTAFINDVAADMVYAQQVLGYGSANDVLMGISTSGNAQNVLYAGVSAKAQQMQTIGLTGERACRMDGLFDVVIHVPAVETYQVQEYHLPVYHAICLAVERHFFG